jgi:hypothetical protein
VSAIPICLGQRRLPWPPRSGLRISAEPINSAERQGNSGMPLTPQQDALCQKLEQQVVPEIGLAAAALIHQQASEIDSLWDRLTHAYMAMRGEVGDDSQIKDEFEELRRLAETRHPSASAPPSAGTKQMGYLPRRTRWTELGRLARLVRERQSRPQGERA